MTAIKLNIISSIKNFFTLSGSEPYRLISGGLTGFFIIFIVNAILGLYSIFGISNDLSENLRGIDLVRNAQTELQGQVLAWENILLSGGSFTEFQRNYHEFSRRSERVANILFNLKLQNTGQETVSEEIEQLRGMHKKVTEGFTIHIVDMKEKNFANVREKVIVTKGMEDELLGSLGDITVKIEKNGHEKSRLIITRYMVIVSISSAVFIILLFYFGKRTGRKLLKNHHVLENMVQERTKSYIEANLSLEKEIEEHKNTEQKLIISKDIIEAKNRLLSASEMKYRHIVEGTSDIIFTLDELWFFKTANDAVKTELKISPEDITGYRLTDLIHGESGDAAMTRKFIMEKLADARRRNKRVKFNAHFKTPGLIEPLEFKVSLEFIEIEGSSEIIGKAVKVSDERYTDSFISEKCEYRIKNLLFTADDISRRVTINLQKYLEKNDVSMIRMGLREILINSIEHGNLNISFEEKTEAIMNDTYFELINERQKQPEFRDRYVTIEYMISPVKAIYKITDQGRGFNHRRYLSARNENIEDVNEKGLLHGRGIGMIKNIFDEVKYNIKGNQVFLVKHLIRSGNSIKNETSIEYTGLRDTQVS